MEYQKSGCPASKTTSFKYFMHSEGEGGCRESKYIFSNMLQAELAVAVIKAEGVPCPVTSPIKTYNRS